MSIVTLVPPGYVSGAYLHIHPFLIKSVEWAQGTSSVDDISRDIFHPHTQLWVVMDDEGKVRGYLATQIVQHPQAKHFTVLHCAGEDGYLESCVDKVFETFDEYARDQGCDAIEIKGRHAWWKHVQRHGYTSPMRQYYKSLRG